MKRKTGKPHRDIRQKDIAEKTLEELSDVFADICNVLLFDGEQVISARSLLQTNPRTNYSAAGTLRELERDTAKLWKKNRLHIAMFGFENQTVADTAMPVRIIGYDGASYRAQYPSKKAGFYPVVTLVLYFGYKRHWRKPESLLDCLNVPDRLKPYVSDYGMNLFEIAYLDDSTVKKFKSDFRYVADYFTQMRKTGKYTPAPDSIKHVSELLNLFSALTGDDRFSKSYESLKRRNQVNMCTVLDEVEARGIIIGAIQALVDIGVPKKDILDKIMSKYNLSNSESRNYYTTAVKKKKGIRFPFKVRSGKRTHKKNPPAK